MLQLHNLNQISLNKKKKTVFKFFIWRNSYSRNISKKEYRKENQTKTIKYIDLEKYHLKNKPSEENKKELYERNKNIFFTEFKSIRYVEINPEKISGSKEYNEPFFKQLDK